MGPVPPPNPSFSLHVGPITKGWSTTACSAAGAGPSKVPPQPPYLSLPFILLTLTSLFLFSRPKEAQHFPARKVVRLPKDPPRSRFWAFRTFSCSTVFPISPPHPSACLSSLAVGFVSQLLPLFSSNCCFFLPFLARQPRLLHNLRCFFGATTCNRFPCPPPTCLYHVCLAPNIFRLSPQDCA